MPGGQHAVRGGPIGSAGSKRVPPRGMLENVMEGLARPQKELSPKYFYDAVGSALFEEITELPEYYLTRTERALLESHVPEWMADLAPMSLVELGAGSALKTRLLLDRLPTSAVYVPLDVSETFLLESSRRLRVEYPQLQIEPHVADFARPLTLPLDLPGPTLFAFLGSTLGNFAPSDAVRLLEGVRAVMAPRDALLLGVDLRPGEGKSVERVERAYNDAAGVTAAFNLNVLSVLNRELAANFDPAAFDHRAFYSSSHGRIEMHLVARDVQAIEIPRRGTVALRQGESIRTEISCKFDRAGVRDLFDAAGLRIRDWRQDDRGYFALLLGEPV